MRKLKDQTETAILKNQEIETVNMVLKKELEASS